MEDRRVEEPVRALDDHGARRGVDVRDAQQLRERVDAHAHPPELDRRVRLVAPRRAPLLAHAVRGRALDDESAHVLLLLAANVLLLREGGLGVERRARLDELVDDAADAVRLLHALDLLLRQVLRGALGIEQVAVVLARDVGVDLCLLEVLRRRAAVRDEAPPAVVDLVHDAARLADEAADVDVGHFAELHLHAGLERQHAVEVPARDHD
mmetsp:Transcript_24476/g.75791  ORF Transcript_24476/g.75791 Transcript_24476/m.75791 type:complete len:210 (-) Transcript_24476:136-765(-)